MFQLEQFLPSMVHAYYYGGTDRVLYQVSYNIKVHYYCELAPMNDIIK